MPQEPQTPQQPLPKNKAGKFTLQEDLSAITQAQIEDMLVDFRLNGNRTFDLAITRRPSATAFLANDPDPTILGPGYLIAMRAYPEVKFGNFLKTVASLRDPVEEQTVPVPPIVLAPKFRQALRAHSIPATFKLIPGEGIWVPPAMMDQIAALSPEAQQGLFRHTVNELDAHKIAAKKAGR